MSLLNQLIGLQGVVHSVCTRYTKLVRVGVEQQRGCVKSNIHSGCLEEWVVLEQQSGSRSTNKVCRDLASKMVRQMRKSRQEYGACCKQEPDVLVAPPLPGQSTVYRNLWYEQSELHSGSYQHGRKPQTSPTVLFFFLFGT